MPIDPTVPNDALVLLRSMEETDIGAVAAVSLAQDLFWWGEPHGDASDVAVDVARAVSAKGSLVDGSRLAVTSDGVVIGAGLHVGHGQTQLFADRAVPEAPAGLSMLLDWLLASGGLVVDAPAHDEVLHTLFAVRDLDWARSSYELERDSDLSDVPRVPLASGFDYSDFRPGVDDVDIHDLIYSVWTDVPGHTHRPIDEWRELFIGGPRFDPRLVVIARRSDGDRRIAGVAIGDVYDDVGWVMQLAVGRLDRSLGLGRMLLVESLHRLAARGVRRVGLSVEAVNDTALGLYRSVGLEVTAEWQHFTPRTDTEAVQPPIR